MAKTQLVWSGLDEYLVELKKLPEDCVAETGKLVEAGVNGAYVTVSQEYGRHRFTGYLQDHLRISPLRQKGQFIAGLELKSDSPHAWLFDNGSQARHKASGASTGKMWGRTPPTHIFARTVGRTRRALAEQYRAMLLRRGAATVTGE